jgi:hypothetical protein
MKNQIKLNIYLFFLLLLISIKNSDQAEIKMIPDAYMNATAAFVALDSLEKSPFLYFSFDYGYHNQMNKEQIDIAYFKITTELLLLERDINYEFFMKKQEDITTKDLYNSRNIGNTIFWRKIDYYYKETNGNEYDYYIKIKKYGIKNTLIIRIPFLKNQGQIMIENIYSIPDDILNKFTNKGKINISLDWKNQNNGHKNDRKTLLPIPPHPYIGHYNNNNWNDWNFNNNKNINNNNVIITKYPNNYHPFNYYFNYHRYHKHHYIRFNAGFVCLGVILGQIWLIIFILYCIVNRKKQNTRLAVIVGNIQQ